MLTSAPARVCIKLLDNIDVRTEAASAFTTEAKFLQRQLTELRPFLEEVTPLCEHDAAIQKALQTLEGALRGFLEALERCCTQGPIETLFTAGRLYHQMVDSCLRAHDSLNQLPLERLPTIVLAQAKMLMAKLRCTTVSYTTLRKLQSACFDLQEEAERVRIGAHDDGGFCASIAHLALCCSPQQLASDASFLQERVAAAHAKQQHVDAFFFQLSSAAIHALLPGAGGDPQPESQAATHPRGRAHFQGGADGTRKGNPAEKQCGGSPIASVVEKLSSNSTRQGERLALLEALCQALEGQGKAEAAEALKEVGVTMLLRLMATSTSSLRCTALRALAALLVAEPACAGEVVAARGVQVLAHLLTAYLEAHRRSRAPETTSRAAAAAASAGVLVTIVTGPRANGKAAAVAGGRRLAAGAEELRRQQQQQQEQQRQGSGPGGPDRFSGDVKPEESVCMQAIAVLRQLRGSHVAELVSSGAVKALCRIAASCGSLAGAAAAALADAALDSSAAVQMMQERLLVSLADMRRSDRPSEAAPAFACLVVLLQHPGRLLRPLTVSPEDVQTCTDMGKGCDGASTTALLDLVAEAAGGDAGGITLQISTLLPSLLELLPWCLHSTENRTALLCHTAVLDILLRQTAEGHACAALSLKRVALDDANKIAVARMLSKALLASPMQAGSKHAAALALCLADVVRPSSRERSVPRSSTEACSECEQCGTARLLMVLTSSPDSVCRAAGLACLHALAVYGSTATRAALGECGAVVPLVDLTKLEDVALPDSLQPPICTPHCMGQAAAEALAALATTSEALRRDVCMQLCAFLGSSSISLASSACQALKTLTEVSPAVLPSLVTSGAMPLLVTHLSRATSPRSKDTTEMTGQVVLQQRAVHLMWVLCRGGGSAVNAAVDAGAAGVLLQRLNSATDMTQLLDAAAALGPLLKKSAAVREAVGGNGGVSTLLQLTRAASPDLPLWEEALAALAALAALHGPSRAEAARALRQLLVRGSAQEVVAAAAVVARMSSSTAGREALLAEDITDPLVRLLATGDDRAKAAAASAICHLAITANVQLGPCAALPGGGSVRPRLALVRSGAVPALLALLRDAGEPSVCAPGTCGRSATATADTRTSALVAVVEALESLAAGEEGVQAIRAAGGIEVLKEVVSRGKRRVVPASLAKTASNTLLLCM